MKVVPYDPSHEEDYNALIIVNHENLNRTENRGFFLQNLPKPTDRKHFETVTTLAITSGKAWKTLGIFFSYFMATLVVLLTFNSVE